MPDPDALLALADVGFGYDLTPTDREALREAAAALSAGARAMTELVGIAGYNNMPAGEWCEKHPEIAAAVHAAETKGLGAGVGLSLHAASVIAKEADHG